MPKRANTMTAHVRNKLYNFTGKWFLFVPLIIALGGAFGCRNAQGFLVPPKTPRHEVKETIHGVEIIDPYRWLEDGKSKETREWIKAENEYTNAVIGSLPVREELKKRIAELMRVDHVGSPLARNGRYFFTKRSANQELSVICVRNGLEANDVVLIDPETLSSDHSRSVSIWKVSEDGTLMAYAIRQGGEDEVIVKFFDVDRQEDLPDCLPKARYMSVAVKPDKTGFYYVRQEVNGPRVYYHKMGSTTERDAEIFGKDYGPEKIMDVDLSEDGRYLLITVFYGAAAMKTEVYYQDLTKNEPVRTVVNDIYARFEGAIAGDNLFLQTNWQGPNGRILCVDLNNPAKENWREVISEKNAVIESFSPAGGKLFVNYTRNACSQVEVFEPNGKSIGNIELPPIGSVSGPSGRWKGKEAFLTFSSFPIPSIIYRYDISRGIKYIWWQEKIPIKSKMFEVQQVWYTSKDGTKVPMFIVHKKDIKLKGKNPTLLTGYGGFNLSLQPHFSAAATLWVEAGGVFAQPSLRGGGEFGKEWHKAGMLQKKQNGFDDFFAAAEWLIDEGYTKPAKLAISGGSNGGLLVGAAITQKPDLFQAAICSYPLLDMIRYQKFLVAKFWITEYGSSDNADQFKYLYAYSPYHRVKPGTQYPAVLFVTGDSDTRVDPLHARKMTALMQSTAGSDKPVLLLYDTKAGHSGERPTNKQIEEMTDKFSFLFWQILRADLTVFPSQHHRSKARQQWKGIEFSIELSGLEPLS